MSTHSAGDVIRACMKACEGVRDHWMEVAKSASVESKKTFPVSEKIEADRRSDGAQDCIDELERMLHTVLEEDDPSSGVAETGRPCDTEEYAKEFEDDGPTWKEKYGVPAVRVH